MTNSPFYSFRKKNQASKEGKKIEEAQQLKVRHVDPLPSHLFFQHNTALGPPYHILLDTNFINKSFQNKLDILPALMDCLFAKCNSRCIFLFFLLSSCNRYSLYH